MRLDKFPVTYEGKEYWATVHDDEWSTIPNITVRLYEQQQRKFTFWGLLKKTKFAKVFSNISGWNRYDEFRGKYIELVKETVRRYHKQIQKQIEEELQYKKGLTDWNSWDGRME